MERLRHTDYRRLLDFVAGLQEPVGLAGFGGHVVRLTAALVPGATIAFDQIHERSGRYGFDHNLPLDPAELARVHARLPEVYRENPIYDYIKKGGKGPVVDLADLMPECEFQRTNFYQDIFRPFDLEHQVTVLLSRGGWINALAINRDHPVPERTKTLLAFASRHVCAAHRNACWIDRLTNARTPLETMPFTAREAEVYSCPSRVFQPPGFFSERTRPIP